MELKKQYYTEFASIKPDATSFYNRPEIHSNRKTEARPIVVARLVDNRKFQRLKSALNYLIITSKDQKVWCKLLRREFKFKLNFITLTLSEKQKHDDKYIKKYILDPFLKFILYKGASGYVWKAERQKNGNIHFHITTNKYIHYKEIRDKWNHLQWKNNYLLKYQSLHNSIDANSTDVKAVVNQDKAVRYMFKYILKKENGKEPIEGHTFGYSRNLTNIKLRLETLTTEFSEIISYLNTLKTHTICYDYVTTMYHDLIDLSKCPLILKRMILEATQRKKGNNQQQLSALVQP